MDLLIKGLTVHTPDASTENGSVAINAGKIAAINQSSKATKVLEFPSSYHLVPGMIDVHIHGASGADVMDGKAESLATICSTLPKEGTTAFLASTMSEPIANIDRALTTVADFVKTNYHGAEILGIHLEGPFISKKRAGAQRAECVIAPDLELFKHWQNLSNNLIKQVTVAPEEPGALELIRYLTAQHIITAVGHSDADYDQAIAAINAGASNATHLFNAMRGLTHREPNAVTALLNADTVATEMIVDGVHLHPAIVELVYRLKGNKNTLLVTDAMRAKCCCDGEYTLGGQAVFVKDNQARLANGVLAGSILKMNDAVHNMMQFTGCTLRDIMAITAETPARLFNVSDRKGSISINKDADLVVLDERYQVVTTICRGQVSYETTA